MWMKVNLLNFVTKFFVHASWICDHFRFSNFSWTNRSPILLFNFNVPTKWRFKIRIHNGLSVLERRGWQHTASCQFDGHPNWHRYQKRTACYLLTERVCGLHCDRLWDLHSKQCCFNLYEDSIVCYTKQCSVNWTSVKIHFMPYSQRKPKLEREVFMPKIGSCAKEPLILRIFQTILD